MSTKLEKLRDLGDFYETFKICRATCRLELVEISNDCLIPIRKCEFNKFAKLGQKIEILQNAFFRFFGPQNC